ncbi:hypothetical protein CANCADRAFT_138900 [Tortispora caseinolytica NRRL Y-17796]|uniref:Clathrin light chain n=1 Tax=Tortispora caseinolytica NRRL Y-17796 TaxID=767744 RepID=A0A1E4TC71_9ASCO|nr:hypothetical protein CANCADRAFT_138900 [Tortispora caseinolytica NRRL Y-17796]
MSKFPSLEEIESGKTEIIDIPDDADEADLVTREREALGADAEELIDDFPAVDDAGVESGEVATEFPPLEAEPTGNIVLTEQEPEVVSSEEPAPVREWRERQALAIERRDAQSAAEKEKTIKEAQQAIDDFYNNYNEKVSKGIEQVIKESEEFIAARDAEATGSPWSRIVKLIDVTDKAASGKRDKFRMRELLLSLKDDAKAPGGF